MGNMEPNTTTCPASDEANTHNNCQCAQEELDRACAAGVTQALPENLDAGDCCGGGGCCGGPAGHPVDQESRTSGAEFVTQRSPSQALKRLLDVLGLKIDGEPETEPTPEEIQAQEEAEKAADQAEKAADQAAIDRAVVFIKTNRVALDSILQVLKDTVSFEIILAADVVKENTRIESGIEQQVLAIRDLESAIMRLGMVLKSIRVENPYPNSYKPENAVVDKTSDVKL